MKYNYYYYGVAIPRNQFLLNVPENWESEVDEHGVFSWGGYKAVEITINEE